VAAGFGNCCFLDSAIRAGGIEHFDSVCGANGLGKAFEQEAQIKSQIQQSA
jgi:hypothetical protein